MKTSDFKYELPEALIAQEPAPVRSASRMMILDKARGSVRHAHVPDLPELLRSGDLLVLNDTKVFPARMFGYKDTGGLVEALFVEEIEPGIWKALVKSSRPLSKDKFVLLGSGAIKIMLHGKMQDGSVLLKVKSDGPVLEILEREGVVPLPPYINRSGADDTVLDTMQAEPAPQMETVVFRRFPAGDLPAPGLRQADDQLRKHTSTSCSLSIKRQNQALIDRDRYQTIYARHTGAVAAPTAGLHFTDELFAILKDKGVKKTHITLHVGPGTFKPVKSSDIEAHRMEEERFVLSAETARLIRETKENGGRVVAVGSTVVRTLESVALANKGVVKEQSGRTGIFIYPPFKFEVVDAMLTNFHLPESTLIMMVCAFAGYSAIMSAYKTAVQERYRFFSYGDCMFIH